MKRTDKIFTFAECEPRKAFYWIFTDEDGTATYHKTTSAEYSRFRSIFGVPPTNRWSYTCHEADRVN